MEFLKMDFSFPAALQGYLTTRGGKENFYYMYFKILYGAKFTLTTFSNNKASLALQ